uniref:Putative secreted protein n=1 Tax=Anopheles triannulatus TaxID=58253 RepID=A0A2M4B7D4_9DIPT
MHLKMRACMLACSGRCSWAPSVRTVCTCWSSAHTNCVAGCRCHRSASTRCAIDRLNPVPSGCGATRSWHGI